MRAAWWIAIACACGKGAEPTSNDERPAAPQPHAADAKPAALDGLKVTLEGKPVAMTHAYSKKLGVAGRYQVFITNKESSCHELMDNLFSHHDGEQSLLFNVGERLAPDGTITSVVIDYFDPRGVTIDPGSKGGVNGKDVSVDFTTHAGGAELASAHGTFSAEPCGDQPPDTTGLPKVKHASTATIEFAGKQLPIVGAVLFGDDVLLSTAPKACTRWLPTAEVMIWRSRGFWNASGQWLEGGISNNALPDPKTKAVKLVRGVKGTSDDGATVQLQVSGKGMIDKYPFALSGTVEALDCHGDSGVIP